MQILLVIIGAFLLIFSYLDLKVRAIPSIFLTAVLFAVAVLNPSNLWFGVMSFIMAYLLYEADFFSGVADIKIMTLVGFLFSSIDWLLFYILLVVVLGLFWKIVYKYKSKKEIECPFVPVFFIIFLISWFLGGIK